MSEDNAFDSMATRGTGNPLRAARAKFPIDSKAVRELNREFSTLKGHLKDIHKQLKEIQQVAPGLTGLGGAGGSGGYLTNMAAPLTQKASENSTAPSPGNDPVTVKSNSMMAKLAAGAFPNAYEAGGGTRLTGKAMGANIAGQIIGQITGAAGDALNARIDRGYSYSLAADKMNMMYQQMTGMSQLDVQRNYRQPLTNYRIGETGVNDLLQMQAYSGINARNQVSSIDAIRSISGYGYSSQQAASMVQGLSDPGTVNRMFMTTGLSLYGPGGEERKGIDVVRGIAQRMGLTNNKALAESALRQGSITRSNMSFMGVQGEMQDTIIQYGMYQNQFRAAGGAGMYDPSDPAHRKLLGVNDSFASEVEDTAMTNVKREEQFYRRQVDNFASLERQTQSLTKKFAELEDGLQGLIGSKISNNAVSGMVGSMGSALGMGALTAGGALMMAPIPGAQLAGGITMGVGALTLGISKLFGGSGDAPEMPGRGGRSAGMSVPAYGGTTRTLDSVRNSSSFNRLHPTMKQRVMGVLRDGGGRIGLGEGYRSPDDQKKLFLSRYRRTDKNTGTYWDGSYWEHVSGPVAAPPGRSFHQVGLAVDFVYQNLDEFRALAKKHKLSLLESQGEPWHAQPEELPMGWSQYEKMGMPWGKPDASATAGGGKPDSKVRANTPVRIDEHGNVRASVGGKIDTYFGMSLSDMVASSRSSTLAGNVDTGVSSPSYVPEGSPTTTKVLTGALSAEQIVSVLQQGGLSGIDLVKGVGISHRESGWNTRAYNGNSATGDKSYGLFQINMINSLESYRKRLFGITNNEDLFDAYTNVKAMQKMRDVRRASGQNPWYDWGPYKDKPETFNVDMAMAARTVKQVTGRGDAPSAVGGSSAPIPSPAANINTKSINVTIAPNITVQGGSNPTYDAHQLARELAPLIEREARTVLMRST